MPLLMRMKKADFSWSLQKGWGTLVKVSFNEELCYCNIAKEKGWGSFNISKTQGPLGNVCDTNR